MTVAEREAHARMNRTVIVMICGAVPIALAFWLLPDSHIGLASQGVICAIATCLTIVAFLRTVMSGKARCPNCSSRTARFVERDSLEFLTCPECGFDEPTGYDYTS